MTKRKHAEKIKAWADNDELVVFRKGVNSDRWYFVNGSPSWLSDAEYFLCLPEHNEKGQCLHWLNGGEVEYKGSSDSWRLASSYLEDPTWYKSDDFMSESWECRIKPKKEKRWIAVLPSGRVSGWHSTNREELANEYNEKAGWQFIEIEVEV